MQPKKTVWDQGDRDHAMSLPSKFFFDPGIFADEKQAIFFKSWHVVGHVNEFKEPGSYVTQDIFEQSVIVIGGRDGQIRAFHNVCQHRGNRLISE
ncbi:MAG TPA: Rieske 2Fe-2S domain-containing protein, partial [Dongiaceae bacterium]